MVSVEVDMSVVVPVPLQHRYICNAAGVPHYWAWCEQTFGPANDSAYGRPATEHYWRLQPGPGYRMWFADPAHATLFALRWS